MEDCHALRKEIEKLIQSGELDWFFKKDKKKKSS